MSTTSSRPLGLRLLNGVGGALRAAGLPLVRLDEASLLAEASRRARLDDFGDDAFRDPLRRLLASYESEARLTLLGRLIARRDAVRLLENRLHLADTCRRHPEIAATEATSLRAIFQLAGSEAFALAGRASQLLDWQKQHRFCGQCGSRTEMKTDEHAMCCLCRC